MSDSTVSPSASASGSDLPHQHGPDCDHTHDHKGHHHKGHKGHEGCDHGPSSLHNHDHDHGPWVMVCLVLGSVFLLASYATRFVFPDNPQIGHFAAFIAAILLAIPIFYNAITELMHGHMHFSEFVALGILASMVYQDYKAAAIIGFFMLIAEFIEHRTAQGAHEAIEGLVRMTPSKAIRLTASDAEEEVAAVDLRVGDRVRIRPGENIPADGTIVLGKTTLNESTITGESLPRDKGADESVFAGTTNLTGMIEIDVTKVGEDTTLGKVKDLILSAEQSKLPIMKIVDRYARHYTPTILMLTAVVWFFTDDWKRVVGMLIMACPCAFILATPTAMVAAIAAAARRGILFKNMVDLEAASQIDAVILDKTGTLTTGELGVVKMIPAEGVSKSELLQTAGSAEQFSNHPAGKAVVRFAQKAGLQLEEASDVTETAGAGATATVQGKKVLAGRSGWLRENNIQIMDTDSSEEAAGLSIVHVSRDGQYLGWLGLRDQIRDQSKAAVEELRQIGITRIAMLTGDRDSVAQRIAGELGGIETISECLPGDKAAHVERITEEGYTTAFVGDGANDAPALAASRTGIAMGAAGNDIAIHSSTVALMNNDLSNLPYLIKLSRASKSVIYQNLTVAGIIILGGMIAIAFGHLTAIIAAILHTIGSVIVVFNSARLVRFGQEEEGDDLGLFTFDEAQIKAEA